MEVATLSGDDRMDTNDAAPQRGAPPVDEAGDKAFCLPESRIWLREDDSLVRIDEKGNAISSFPLDEVTGLKCGRSIGWGMLSFSAALFWAAYAAFTKSESLWIRWILGSALGGVGFLTLLGGGIEGHLVISTKDGKVIFPVMDSIDDARAFALTVMRIKNRGRR